jgi:predicted ABC-class ATPase
LYDELGVSSILVIGGSGDYFSVADTVVMMDSYKPVDVTEKALAIAKKHAVAQEERWANDAQGAAAAAQASTGHDSFGEVSARLPEAQSLKLHGKMGVKRVGELDVVVSLFV